METWVTLLNEKYFKAFINLSSSCGFQHLLILKSKSVHIFLWIWLHFMLR